MSAMEHYRIHANNSLLEHLPVAYIQLVDHQIAITRWKATGYPILQIVSSKMSSMLSLY